MVAEYSNFEKNIWNVNKILKKILDFVAVLNSLLRHGLRNLFPLLVSL